MSSLYMGSFRLRFSISFCFSLFALRSIPSYFTLDFLPANFASPSSLSPSIFWTLQRFCYLFVFRTPLSIVYVAARRHSPSLLPLPFPICSQLAHIVLEYYDSHRQASARQAIKFHFVPISLFAYCCLTLLRECGLSSLFFQSFRKCTNHSGYSTYTSDPQKYDQNRRGPCTPMRVLSKSVSCP